MNEEKRHLKVDLEELKYAMDSAFEGTSNYLDLETGDVVPVTDETRWQLEALLETTDADTLDAILAVIQAESLDDWEKDELRSAALVEAEYNTRFIAIPQADSRKGYADMAAFIETVSGRHLQELLQVAIQGKGAFRRFKDVLVTYPQERERWFEFQDERLHQRALDWLESEGINPTG